MAKITIAGNSYVITSSVSMADLETVKKYRPSVLTLTDEDTKESYFKVGVGSGSISEYGVSFGGVSNDNEKLATATLPIPSDVTDAKTYVLDKAGMATFISLSESKSLGVSFAGINSTFSIFPPLYRCRILSRLFSSSQRLYNAEQYASRRRRIGYRLEPRRN